MEILNVLLVQADLVWESPSENRRRIETLLEGEEGQADLIVLPEMFTTGFSMTPEGLAESMEGPTLAWMAGIALRQSATVMGSIIVKEGEHYYNRMLVVGQNGLQLFYDKRHLFRMAGEHKSYAGGTQRPVFNLKGWRICPQICYDLRFPAYVRNRFDESGRGEYDLLVYVANWPAVRVSHWSLLLKARAIENQAYTIGVNRVGEDGNGIPYSGDSAVVDPKGNVLVEGRLQEQLLKARLDGEAMEAYRKKFPVWMDADRLPENWEY